MKLSDVVLSPLNLLKPDGNEEVAFQMAELYPPTPPEFIVTDPGNPVALEACDNTVDGVTVLAAGSSGLIAGIGAALTGAGIIGVPLAAIGVGSATATAVSAGGQVVCNSLYGPTYQPEPFDNQPVTSPPPLDDLVNTPASSLLASGSFGVTLSDPPPSDGPAGVSTTPSFASDSSIASIVPNYSSSGESISTMD